MSTYTKPILGCLIDTPVLLESTDLTVADFPPGREQTTFAGITKIWEDLRPTTMPLHLLAEAIGGDAPLAYLLSLTEGVARMTPEALDIYVRQHRSRMVARQIFALTEAESKQLVKTGDVDLDKLQEIGGLFAQLQQPTNGGPELAELDPREIKMRPITHVGHYLRSLANAVCAEAGMAKTLVTCDATGRVTTGRAFPTIDKPRPAVKGHVFYVTSEGAPELILVPRLVAAGADLAKVTIIEGIREKSGAFSILDVTQHIPILEKRARDFPDLQMIVIDPIASFLPERLNPNQTNAVRQAMDRISDMAYRLGVAVVVVMHFAKASAGVKAINRTAGSHQFLAAIKMSWSVVHRPGDPLDKRLLVPQKSNVSAMGKSLSFTIQPVEFPSPDDPASTIETAKIEWGELVDEDPETLISPPIETPNNNVSAAREFLARKLEQGGTLYAKPLIDEAEEQGIPKWALYKAKDKMGILDDKEGKFQGRSFWYKPKGGEALCP